MTQRCGGFFFFSLVTRCACDVCEKRRAERVSSVVRLFHVHVTFSCLFHPETIAKVGPFWCMSGVCVCADVFCICFVAHIVCVSFIFVEKNYKRFIIPHKNKITVKRKIHSAYSYIVILIVFVFVFIFSTFFSLSCRYI